MAAFDVYGGFQMDIFVYSDESGVFDCYHSQYFVFGGGAFLDRETMESAARRYLTVEKEIRKENLIYSEDELKAGYGYPKETDEELANWDCDNY